MKRLLDRSLLIIAATICAGFAHVFWSQLGESELEVFASLFVLYLVYENHRLRLHIRDLKNAKKE